MFLLAFVLVHAAAAALTRTSTLRGLYTTVVVHDKGAVDNYMYVLADGHTLYVVGISDQGAADRTFCTPAVTTQIITSQRGCDGPDAASSFLRVGLFVSKQLTI